MSTPITFPDAVDVALSILDGIGVPRVTKIPNPRPASFVLVRRDGGPRRSLVTDRAQVRFESYGSSEQDALSVASEVRSRVNAARSTDDAGPVREVTEYGGPAFFPDPLTDQPRYRQTFTLALRGAET